jgi:NADH:ubiquinone oxidoreductase subunit 5 (subunit L)/multisubunit Na+/H+ antiporter MnhA subunit
MSEQQRYEKQEKEEEKQEKEEEKDEKSWDEKWRRDPLSAIVWAAILIWAGLVLLAGNLNLLVRLERVDAWDLILAGAGLIVLLEAAVRLIVPDYRRPLGGTLTLGLILLALGLGGLVGAVWPVVLIAIGVGMLLRGLMRGR